MIKLSGIHVDVPYNCDGCGTLKNRLTEIKFIYKSDSLAAFIKRTNGTTEGDNIRQSRAKAVGIFLCYRCRNLLHTSLGKHIQTFAGPY